MDRHGTIIPPEKRRWPGRRGVARWSAVAVAVTCVLAVAVRVALATLTYAGPVTVTAHMGAFSPNPVEVKVNSSATSSLSSGYTPPSGVPEGDLSAKYDWTVTQVQYKATVNDPTTGKLLAYGSPPSGSYVSPILISPSQPSTSSGATLTFTPLTAGYWQISVSCSVTVTDTKTNQYWSGSANAGPEDLTSYLLHIEYGGVVVDGQTQDVSVGEYIPLDANYGPSDMTLQWNVKGSIIADYAPKPKQTFDQSATITPITSAELTQPSLTYYWMDTDSGSTEDENVTLTGKLPSGENPSPVNTTFNVYRPVPSFTTQYLGPIALDTNYFKAVGTLTLHDGGEAGGSYDPGIEFSYSIPTSQFGGTPNLGTVQIVGVATVTTKQYNSDNGGSYVTFEYTQPSNNLPAPLLDTQFPYVQEANGQTSDSPDYAVDPPPAGSGFGPGNWSTENVSISEAFTHNLFFVPTAPAGIGTNYAPLSQVQWGWTAEADNGTFGFSLVSSAKVPASPPTNTDLSTLPTWNSNSQPAWNDPQWFALP